MPRFQNLPTLTLLLASTLALAPTAVAVTPSQDINETALVKRVERLLGFPSDTGQLILGRLPDHLPVHLPLPEGAQVIGSIVRSANNFQILLDVAQSPAQIKAFYQQQLLRAGWKQRKFSFGPNQGFVISPSDFGLWAANHTVFCQELQRASLLIETNSPPNAPTEVRLRLKGVKSATSTFDCVSSIEAFDLEPFPPLAPLPTLSPPPKVQVSSLGSFSSVQLSSESSSSDQLSSSSVVLETQLDIQSLLTHYAAQFEQAGWKRRNSEQDGPLVWSTWTMKDNKGLSWQGLLNITRIGGLSNRYIAYEQVWRTGAIRKTSSPKK